MIGLSVTARIALLSIALALIANLALIGFVWRQTHAEAIQAIRRETIEQAESFSVTWREGGVRALVDAIKDARTPIDPSLTVLLFDAQGRRVVGFGPSRLIVDPLGSTDFRIARIGTAPPWSESDSGYVVRRLGPWTLFTARVLDLVAEEERALRRALGLSMLLSLGLGIAAGLVVTRYVGRRLDSIAAVVEQAGEGDLSRRVTLSGSGGDAFDRLAGQLNAMLARLERLMGELRVVTDGLAHDLRSPLARLRTKTETALLDPDPQAREGALGGLLVETDLVLRMLSTLIEISRSGAVTRDRFIRLSPATLVEEIGELYAPVMEEAGLSFDVAVDSAPPALLIHRELLSQAITNLLDNAIHHAADGGDVVLRLMENGHEVAIQVEDRGPGIAAEDRPQALRRFGRLDAARTTPGAGLGLSLIEAVARLHGGRFDLGENAPGLVARIVLPG